MLLKLLSPVPTIYAITLCVLLLVCAAPLFFIGGPDWVSPPLIKNLWNFGHVVFFALLLMVLQCFIALNHWRHWLGVTLAALLLGIAIETVQHFVGRYASWGDVFNNLAGVWLGLFWGQLVRGARFAGLIKLGRIVSLVLIAPALWLIVESAWAEWNLRRAFPQLNSFETSFEWQQLVYNPARVDAHLTNRLHSHGQQALAVQLKPGASAGLRLRVCYGDWRHYNHFVVDLYNPGAEPLSLSLRLSDTLHDRGEDKYNDRFNRTLVLAPGWNTQRIAIADIQQSPATRELQMDKLCNLGLFVSDIQQTQHFYIDNLRLE